MSKTNKQPIIKTKLEDKPTLTVVSEPVKDKAAPLTADEIHAINAQRANKKPIARLPMTREEIDRTNKFRAEHYVSPSDAPHVALVKECRHLLAAFQAKAFDEGLFVVAMQNAWDADRLVNTLKSVQRRAHSLGFALGPIAYGDVLSLMYGRDALAVAAWQAALEGLIVQAEVRGEKSAVDPLTSAQPAEPKLKPNEILDGGVSCRVNGIPWPFTPSQSRIAQLTENGPMLRADVAEEMWPYTRGYASFQKQKKAAKNTEAKLKAIQKEEDEAHDNYVAQWKLENVFKTKTDELNDNGKRVNVDHPALDVLITMTPSGHVKRLV